MRNPVNLLVLVLALLALGCGRSSHRPKREVTPVTSPSSAQTTSSTARPSAELEPLELLRLPVAAYHVALAADEDAAYLLTSSSAYRLEPGQQPRQFVLDLGEGPVMTGSSFVYWSKGAVWRAPKSGGVPQKLASVPHKPQYFATSGDYWVWLDRTDEGRCTIRTLDRQKQRVVYEAQGEIDALTMMNDWAFFAERVGDRGWRLGGVSRAGGHAAYSAVKQGRSPAMLVANDRDIYYYDINRIAFRRISSDLHNEEVILENFVCSPIALSQRVHCGQVEGLVELAPNRPHEPRLLTPGRNAPITAIAANSSYVAWVVDIGANQLAVRALAR